MTSPDSLKSKFPLDNPNFLKLKLVPVFFQKPKFSVIEMSFCFWFFERSLEDG
jgi:hypothetical protein